MRSRRRWYPRLPRRRGSSTRIRSRRGRTPTTRGTSPRSISTRGRRSGSDSPGRASASTTTTPPSQSGRTGGSTWASSAAWSRSSPRAVRAYHRPMDLFAGICVRDYEAAKAWYERFFGREPTFVAHETECVWDLADHRSIFILEDSDRAGCATHTIFVDNLEAIVDEIASRGIK